MTDSDTKSIRSVYGIGDKKAADLKSLGILTVDDLRKNQELTKEKGKVNLTATQSIGLKYHEDLKTRLTKVDMLFHVKWIMDYLPSVTICGGYRRENGDFKDIDIMLPAENYDSKKVLTKLGTYVKEVISNGDQKMVLLVKHPSDSKHRILDVYFYNKASAIPMLFYLTGSHYFNVYMRTEAATKGYKLNQNELMDAKGDIVPLTTEHEIFRLLGLDYIEPKDRNFTKEQLAAYYSKVREAKSKKK